MYPTITTASTAEVLWRAMRQSLLGYWQASAGYQKFLYLTGSALLASSLYHTAVLVLQAGSWQGDVSWRKPILFGFSFGITALSIGWALTFLPRHRWRGWLLGGALGLGCALEVILVSVQQWRGVPSHFNETTPFNTAVWVLMGLSIALVSGAIVVVTVWSWLSLRGPASMRLAIRLGLLLLVASQGFGGLMIAAGGNQFGAAGLMKLPHALSLHAIQLLPFLAWLLLFTDLPEPRRTTIVLSAAAGYFGLLAASAWQTFSGLAPLAVSPPAAFIALSSAAVLVAGYTASALAVRAKYWANPRSATARLDHA